ncbi:MAG: adenylate/guanylate cyclase domain-containing protein [Cyanobacteria bacterium P01_D01_bin.105]
METNHATSQMRPPGLFRSRLAKQIAAWVFLGIVTIEGIVFIPSYGRRRDENLRKLEAVSQEVLNTVKLSMMSDTPQRELLGSVQLREDSVIKGIALYKANGKFISSLGEAPEFTAETLTQPMVYSIWQIANDPGGMNAIRQLSQNGDRYDVAWPGEKSPYILAIRHDATVVHQMMGRYVLGVTILVIIISAFVTLVTLAVIQRIVIRPLLLLRDDLAVVGEAIAQSQTPQFASLARISHNELGEVSTAFQRMFERIQTEICDRRQAEADLRKEQQKAERLLLNILPAQIAAQLKENEDNKGAIANRFDTATILFADIVNFTNLAANTSPTALVCQLNDIFSAFDAIAERHRLEKIKTIGDAYMVVGGVPSPNENHAQSVMAMAIEMMEFAQGYSVLDQNENPHQLCLRIGINTGPVVAGVIGTKKFSYDLWGDAVNIASRMESHGLVNRIQVSEETYLHLKESYLFEARGYLTIKGRGEMRAFLLKSALPNDLPIKRVA